MTTRPVRLTRKTKSRKRRPVLHVGLHANRLRNDSSAPERIFSEAWQRENEEHTGYNYGMGTLQDLLVVHVNSRQKAKGWWRYPAPVRHSLFKPLRLAFVITRRDAVLVATVIEWLGTNCGFGFLQSTLEKCGYRLVDRKDPWNASEPVRVCTSRTRSFQGCCPHCGRMFHHWPPVPGDTEVTKHRALFGSSRSPEPPPVHCCERCGGRYTVAALPERPAPSATSNLRKR